MEEELLIKIFFPYSSKEPRELSVPTISTIGSIYTRALTLFPEVDNNSVYKVFVELVDATYINADLNKPLTFFQIPEKPTVALCPLKHEITIKRPVGDPVTLEVELTKPVNEIKDQVCKNIGAVDGSAFVLVHGQTPLFNNLPIPEQCPGADTFELVDASTENTKINFSEAYLRGPVYLPFSDALQLSAYLLQATVGPARSYTGQISELIHYLPARLRDEENAAVDLHLEWSFLSNVTRDEANRIFTQKVQALPLFNCVSFSASKLGDDKTTGLPEKFEIIYTERRIIALDYFKFKTRFSIDYADIISVRKIGHDIVAFEFSQDGITRNIFKFKTPTSNTILHKTYSIITGQDPGEHVEEEYTFRTCEEIEQEAKTVRPMLFEDEYIRKFVTQDDDRETSLTNADLMHALLIRADSCAWHLSVLLDKVNENTAKVLKDEISSYYSRLMAYLKYLSYDIRPYDHAWEIGRLLCALETKHVRAQEVIHDVLTNLAIVRRSFVPISTDPIYVTSRAVIAYVLSHTLSCMELPYATSEHRVDAFAELVAQFLNNGLELKDLIGKYLYYVGDIEIKKNLQVHLDFIFRHHLRSLVLFPLITGTSQFKDVDPSIILHQDSCNTMMTSMIEFSRVLWEDRKALPEDHLKEFLGQAADLCKNLMSSDNANGIIVKTVQEFAKVISFNLPGLFGEHRTIFSMILPLINAFTEDYARSKSLQATPVACNMVNIMALLILDQPEQLAEEANGLIAIYEGTLCHIFEQYASDIELFELDVDESRNTSACALKCYIQSTIEYDASGKTPNQLFQMIAPALALSAMLDRPTSEYCIYFSKLFAFYKFYVHALVYRSIYIINSVYLENGLEVSEETKKKLESLKTVKDVEYLIPSGRIIGDINTVREIAEDEIISQSPVGAILSEVANHEVEYPRWGEVLDKAENVKIMVDSAFMFAQLIVASTLMGLGIDNQRVMLTYPTTFYSTNFVIDVFKQLSRCAGYFEASRIFMSLQVIINGMANSSNVLFTSCVAPDTLKQSIADIAGIIKTITTVCADDDLTPLFPIQEFNVPDVSSDIVSIKADHRLEMGTIMGEFRVSVNEFIDSMILKEKENAEEILNSILHSCKKVISLINYLDPTNAISKEIYEGLIKFFKSIPRLWTYSLMQLHIRDELEPLDHAYDEAVDLVASKMYEPATTDKLKEIIDETNRVKFEPHDRDEFVHLFVAALTKYSSSQKEDDVIEILYEMMMLLRDNSLLELMTTTESLSDEVLSLTQVFDESKYCKMVIAAEEALEKVRYMNGYVWFESLFEKLVDDIKERPFNQGAITGINTLIERMDSAFSPSLNTIGLIQANIESASGLLSEYPTTNLIIEESKKAGLNMIGIEKVFNEFTETFLKNGTFSGNALIYKGAALQIVTSYYKEFKCQGWSSDSFVDICKIVRRPLSSDFSASALSTTLLEIRRNLRSIRLHKPTVHPRFITDTEKTLNDMEKSLNDSFEKAQEKVKAKVEKQTTIIKGYVNTLVKAPNGQIKNFVVRLINNLALDLTPFKIFEADQMKGGIVKLYEGLKKTNNKEDHIKALIKWINQIDENILPVNVQELLEILKQISVKLRRSEESLIDYNQTQMISIAVSLSDALAKLAKIRESLDLIKDYHWLSDVKEILTSFIITIMRSLEAYADEIHTFSVENHPVVSIIDTIPHMCDEIEQLIESSFMLTSNLAECSENVVKAINQFVENCPEDLKVITEKEAEAPIKALNDFTELVKSGKLEKGK